MSTRPTLVSRFSTRRSHLRFRLTAPAVVRCTINGTERESNTLTRDVSEAGVFVSCPLDVKVGDEVRIEIQLPPVGSSGREGLLLCSVGKVIRLAGTAEQPGFAIATRFELPD